MKECPLCGTTMRLVTRTLSEHMPGAGQTTAREVREWVCPECDYFEEAESDEQEG